MTMTHRWRFADSAGSWTMPINPNTMTSLTAPKSLVTTPAAEGGQRMRTTMAPPSPFQWSFGGVIRTQDHYMALLDWSERGVFTITTSLEQVVRFLPESFELNERRPTKTRPWRFTYTLTGYVISVA